MAVALAKDPDALCPANSPVPEAGLDGFAGSGAVQILIRASGTTSPHSVGPGNPASLACFAKTALMRWPDVDLDAGIWTIPAETTKSGREHRVPVPREVVAILATLPKLAGSELVFPGRGGAPMTGWSKRMRPVHAASRELGLEPWTLHDLRRTVRTGLARLGVRDEIAERVIGHAVRDHLLATYDRSDRLEEMREALAMWAGHVLELVGGRTAEIPALRG